MAFMLVEALMQLTYVDGISITISNPRKHAWTYAVGISDNLDSTFAYPYAAMPGKVPPSFVGEHYYCECGNTGGYENV